MSAAVVAIEMGYGHMRAAEPLAEILSTPVLRADGPPIGGEDEPLWADIRGRYEMLSRISQLSVVGSPIQALLQAITSIAPLYPREDRSRPTLAVRLLHRLIRRGFGRELVGYLQRNQSTLVTTFYTPAVVADCGGWDRSLCVITDTDLNRIWVPPDPRSSRIHYCVPSLRARRRLVSYGIPAKDIEYTGFPLPPQLTGGPSLQVLRKNLARRLLCLDPKGAFRCHAPPDALALLARESAASDVSEPSPPASPLLTFAVGGAGAQARLVRAFLPSLARAILDKRIRLALVAGIRAEVAARFHEAVEHSGLGSELGDGIRIFLEADWAAYYRSFNSLLAETDILWTKPSELVFYGALGLPEILSSPIGVHEVQNRSWLVEAGGGIEQGDPRLAGQWLLDRIDDGDLAGAAWAGYVRLPKLGAERICERVSQGWT